MRRALHRCKAALDKLREEARKDEQEDASRNTWYGYFFGKALSAGEKEARSRRATERNTGRIVREAELERLQTSADKTQSQIQELRAEIAQTVLDRFLAEKAQAREQARRQQARQQQAAREAEVERARREKESARRREEERARREAEAEQRREQELREYLERVRKEVAARQAKETEERRKKAEELKQYHDRRAKELAASKARETEAKRRRGEDRKGYFEQKETSARCKGNGKQEAQASAKPEASRNEDGKNWGRGRGGKVGGGRRGGAPGTSKAQPAPCQHKGWWNRELGSHECQNCLCSTTKFAFRCPGCWMMACAGCRDILKGKS